jgi:hypothetical protein
MPTHVNGQCCDHDPNLQLGSTSFNRGIDCHWASLSIRDCVCYKRCPRCAVEYEQDVDFGQVNPMRHEDDVLAPHTVTCRDLKSNNDCAAPAHFLSQEEQDESQEDGGIAIVKI